MNNEQWKKKMGIECVESGGGIDESTLYTKKGAKGSIGFSQQKRKRQRIPPDVCVSHHEHKTTKLAR